MSGLDEFEQKPSRRLWIMAAVAALALHVGGAALAIVNLKGDDEAAALGAQGVEVGLVFGSEKNEITDLPPGPDSEEAAASPALAEQKAVEKESDLPKDKVVESEEPDRVVTTTDSKKPEEEDPKLAAVQQNPSEASDAQVASAKQNLEVEGNGIIDPGLLKDKQKAEADWNAMISAVIEAQKARHYPKNKSKNASVKVNFVLNRVGNVLQVSVLESSGDPAFDQAAITMIRSCDPMPKPSAKLTEDTFSRTLVVKFNPRK